MHALNWDTVRMAVFDVDGTLYDQRRMRMLMARDLVLHAARTASAQSIRVLGTYRRARERLGDQGVADFEPLLIAEVARTCRVSPQEVGSIVAEWMESRPVRYLERCRFEGVQAVFDGLRRHGKLIGIFSDYPASQKVQALGLEADFIVSANDAEVGALKPDPRGLAHLMSRAGTGPESTLMIGDRVERDGHVARRLGVGALIRSGKPLPEWRTFAKYDDAVFTDILRA